jgi:hypothetical protein
MSAFLAGVIAVDAMVLDAVVPRVGDLHQVGALVGADVNPPLFAGEVADLDAGVDLR